MSLPGEAGVASGQASSCHPWGRWLWSWATLDRNLLAPSLHFCLFTWYLLPTFPFPEATDLIPLHLLSPLEPGVSDTYQHFCWGTCKGPQPVRAAVAESWLCSRLFWGVRWERHSLALGGVFHLVSAGIFVFTGKSKDMSFRKRSETDFFPQHPHLSLLRLLGNQAEIVCASSLSHVWLCNPMDCHPSGSSVHGCAF